ncbi:MAG: hypothetical protein JXB34_09595 [Bacteroidales bacterium]|nr:hypothetical protein [Bacteroidales bacterium]
MRKIGFILMVSIVAAACNKKPQAPQTVKYVERDSLSFDVIADTITYDVIIKNTVITDPVTDEFLRYLDKTSLIDWIFSSVYSGEIIAYDYFSGAVISTDDLKDIEKSKSFSRESIGKIQFAEAWYYNKEHNIFKKKVISMVLGLEQFNSDGTLRGYKPVFKLYLN